MMYNIKSFWNGTVMSDIDMNEEQYFKILKKLDVPMISNGDFIKSQKLVYDMVKKEESYYKEFLKTGDFKVSSDDNIRNMLIINALVNNGDIPNNDRYGLLFMKFEDKRKSVKRKKKYGYE